MPPPRPKRRNRADRKKEGKAGTMRMNALIHTQTKIFLCRKKHQEYQLEMMLHYTPHADVFKVFKVSVHHMFLFMQ
jgi:hypothetical protein